MDREVDFAAEQRVLDLLDEEPLAAGLRQRRVLEPVAGCLDRHQLRARSAILDEPRDGSRLPERELAAARPDPQSRHETALGFLFSRPALLVSGEPEEPVERVGVGDDQPLVTDRLELFGRGQQQLLDDKVRDLFDTRPRVGRQGRRASARAAAARTFESSRIAGAARRPSG